MKAIRVVVVLSLLIGMGSCKYIRRAMMLEELEDAKLVVFNFYKVRIDEGNELVLPYFADTLFQVIPRAEVDSMFRKIERKMGELESAEFVHGENIVTAGNSNVSTCKIVFSAQYENGKVEETYHLMKEWGHFRIIDLTFKFNISDKGVSSADSLGTSNPNSVFNVAKLKPKKSKTE